ncbi:hypothetical protein R3P38DRAFT_3198240 [Favolaschia claudopus]|uniref:Protein kinase domain-containing protein n=1 Tax=Favolaschia claudopus TaxID=2862362 RepID=A0AAW0B1G3_9AGAR
MTDYVSGVPQVPLDFFLSNIIPPSAEWHPLVEELFVDNGHIVSGRWVRKSSRSTVAKRETDFIHIVNTIIRAGEKFAPHPASCRFLLDLASKAKSQHDLPPDAQFELRDPASRFQNAVPWKLQSSRALSDSNEDELIQSCEEALCTDPCRRFSFGVTLDGDELRIWFFSRSHELAASSFNGITEASKLIRIVLSLAFASAEQLGYDTTMSHIGDAGSAQVNLSVGHNVYVTTELLSDREQDGSCGRSTRVWEAYREDDPDRIPVAVKDLWASADAVPEGDQLLQLHEKLRALSHPSLPHPPGHYFLTVMEHGFVPTSEGVDDDTLLMTRSASPDGVLARRRKHYRIVFREVGTPLHNLQSLSDVMRALADTTRALQLLYELGLVHRDVSAANILFFNGVGKLADLKFMRSYKGPIPSLPSDRYIGTTTFIAGEVGVDTFCYASSLHRPSDAPRRSESPTFRYNPFHDLESTVWIGIWVLFYHRRDIPEVREVFDVYFPPHFTRTTLNHRRLAISCGFHSFDKSDSFHSILEILHGIRNQLHERYTMFESDIHRKYRFIEDEAAPSIGTPFDGLHDELIHEYEEAARLSDSQLLPLARSDAAKREATSEPSPVANLPDATRVGSPARPNKKSKTTSSPRRPPTTHSSGGKRRSSNTRPTRQSARLAEKKRTSSRNRATG